MKELKNIESIYNQEFDINIKPYLSIYEIMVAVQDIIEHDSENNNVIENRVLEDLLLLQIATNISDTVSEDEMLTNDFYDLALQNGLIDVVRRNVKNAHMIKMFYDEYMSVNNIVKRGFKDLVALAEKATKSLPKTQKGWTGLIDKLGEIVNKNGEYNINDGISTVDNAENK